MTKLIRRVLTSSVLAVAASGMFAVAAEAGMKLNNHNETVLRG
jgi:hypothetical protein